VEIVARVKIEEKDSKPRLEKLTMHTPEQSFQSNRKDTLAMETTFFVKPQPVKGVILQVRCIPTRNTPSRMSTSSPCSSCFTKTMSSSYQR